jgi:hypothetical protein
MNASDKLTANFSLYSNCNYLRVNQVLKTNRYPVASPPDELKSLPHPRSLTKLQRPCAAQPRADPTLTLQNRARMQRLHNPLTQQTATRSPADLAPPPANSAAQPNVYTATHLLTGGLPL